MLPVDKTAQKSTLDEWIKHKIGLPESVPLHPLHIQAYQVQKRLQTLEWVTTESPFYRQLLASIDLNGLKNTEDWSRVPFTTAEDLQENPLRFLCVSQSDICRVVTLQTSGTTAAPKRLFFTEADLELTTDFFHHGMKNLVQPGETVLILMPGEVMGSIGDLLQKGLARMQVRGIVHGLVTDPARVWHVIQQEKVNCVVGIPSQVLAVARESSLNDALPSPVRRVLLSADYVPSSVVKAIEAVWPCRVFSHYGMTEMGFGGGVECGLCAGYHMREADLFFEIIDPHSGRILPDGENGEVVFTTLTREGMPLIRYRTGDMARWIPGACPCGSVLRRMGPVQGRITEGVAFDEHGSLSITDLDEVLFTIPTLHDYTAEWVTREDRDHLIFVLQVQPGTEDMTKQAVHCKLQELAVIKKAMTEGTLDMGPIHFCRERVKPLFTGKRRIVDRREQKKSPSSKCVAV